MNGASTAAEAKLRRIPPVAVSAHRLVLSYRPMALQWSYETERAFNPPYIAAVATSADYWKVTHGQVKVRVRLGPGPGPSGLTWVERQSRPSRHVTSGPGPGPGPVSPGWSAGRRPSGPVRVRSHLAGAPVADRPVRSGSGLT